MLMSFLIEKQIWDDNDNQFVFSLIVIFTTFELMLFNCGGPPRDIAVACKGFCGGPQRAIAVARKGLSNKS